MRILVIPLLLISAFACNDGVGPRLGNDPQEIARSFEALSDSMSSVGNFDGAEAMHHVAEIVKLTGRVTPLEISIDGTPMRFLAVSEQIDYPIFQCRQMGGGIAPGGIDSSTTIVDTITSPLPCEPATQDEYYSMRTLIAWQADSLHRIVRLVADTGRSRAPDDIPDAMVGLPSEARGVTSDSGGSIPPDSAIVFPIFYPGFFGEYFVRTQGWWMATQGTEANSLVSLNGPCSRDTLELEWARFACERSRIAFEVSMVVEPSYRMFSDSSGGGGGGGGGGGTPPPLPSVSHKIEMRTQIVDGVRLRLVQFEPPPGPDPIVRYLSATLVASVVNGAVTLRFKVLGDSLSDTDIEFSSGQNYDFEIYTAGGQLVWRWSDGKGFTLAFQRVTLPAGGALTYAEQWGPFSPIAGSYIAVAWLTSTNTQAAGRVGFRF
ncbi:MAG: BsuPI-related putative proteinase inhibitor [Gemmatimonadaceae bacterium]